MTPAVRRLWVRGMGRLRTQLRVVSAFRGAAGRHSLRRRASIMANYALEAPATVRRDSFLIKSPLHSS